MRRNQKDSDGTCFGRMVRPEDSVGGRGVVFSVGFKDFGAIWTRERIVFMSFQAGVSRIIGKQTKSLPDCLEAFF